MRRVALSVYLAVWLAVSPAAAQPLKPEAEQAVDAAMRQAVDSGWAAGGVAAVMRGGEVVFQRAYGFANLETAAPMTPQAVFRIGSLTKQFTAAAMLLLVEDGRLSLDDRVGRYLAAWPGDDPTTLRQLLNHTSGVADYVGAPGFFEREQWLPHTTAELVAYVTARSPLHDFPPGTRWAYSSANYALAGAVIEQVSGRPLGAFFKTRLFDPLGMKDTALDTGREVVVGRASGYDRAKVETPGYLQARTVSMDVPFAAGALRSTARDLLIWTEALTHGRVLKPASYREMISPARLADGSPAFSLGPDGKNQPVSYGLGLTVLGDPAAPVLTHNGAIDGFTGLLRIDTATDTATVVLINTSPSDHLPFGGVIAAVRTGF